jgi:hypothetical protein
VARIDAVTAAEIRSAARPVLDGAPTLAAIGPIAKLPALDAVGRRLRG